MITVALLHKFVYEFRGNNTYIILDRTALITNLTKQLFLLFDPVENTKVNKHFNIQRQFHRNSSFDNLPK